MSKTTPKYNFLYLENGDVIYPGYDQDNMSTAENQLFGSYSYLGEGIIDGWQIKWLGCLSDPVVLLERQKLIDGYREDPNSYYGIQYSLIGLPTTEAQWGKCVMVTTGKGIVDVFHASTEFPRFFVFNDVDTYYIWATKNACTVTEYLCDITVSSDEDYDLNTDSIYIGEVYTGTLLSEITITQILYSERRRELKNAQGDVQRTLKQILASHVHSGEGRMPSKINLNTTLVVKVSVLSGANAQRFTLPSNFVTSNYADPQVYLGSILLTPSEYSIEVSGSSGIIYLTNVITAAQSLQIVYTIAPGPKVFITSSLTPPLNSTPLNFETIYYLTDGTIIELEDGTKQFKIWSWSDESYSSIEVYLKNEKLDTSAYNIYQLSNVANSGGRLQFLGPILPSIFDYNQTDVIIKYSEPLIQVTGKLDSSRIKDINASSFSRGTLSSNRISTLSHFGLFRYNESAIFIPEKRLINSGDNFTFYPEVDQPVQLSDWIINSETINIYKKDISETNIPLRTVFSTPNGLFITDKNVLDFNSIIKTSWNTDNGLADIIDRNYFGNYSSYRTVGFDPISLDSQDIFILSKAYNQFKNVVYLSEDFGLNYQRLTLPNTSSGRPIINDFYYTLEIFQNNASSLVSNTSFDVRYKYYLCTDEGLFYSEFNRNQNKTRPIWTDNNYLSTNLPTGAAYAIAESVNVGTQSISYTGGFNEKKYINYINTYLGSENGLFVFSGINGSKFTTNATNYNLDNSGFYFTKWLGRKVNDNQVYGLIWADSTSLYYSDSCYSYSIVIESSNATSVETKYVQPLTGFETAASLSVRLASSEHVDLSSPITIFDQLDLIDGDLVLLKNQNNSAENGIYIWVQSEESLVSFNTPATRILITDGSHGDTEWVEIPANQENLSDKRYQLYYSNIINIDEHINSYCLDLSSGPLTDSGDLQYSKSFFVSTRSSIYRILCPINKSKLPVVTQLSWDFKSNGEVHSIQHNTSDDVENGVLTVFTSNGIFKSTSDSFVYGPLDSEGVLLSPNNSFVRFQEIFSASQESEISVYDSYALNEYVGKIIDISLATNQTTLSDGIYKNCAVFASNTEGSGLTVDFKVMGGVISNLEINNPGRGYSKDIVGLFSNVNGVIVRFESATTEGLFIANYTSQAIKYSKNTPINPANLLYADSYNKFFVTPWVTNPLITVTVNNTPTEQEFGYSSDLGLINFSQSIGYAQKDKVKVTISNPGQFITNVGNTPHEEIFDTFLSDSQPCAFIQENYDPSTAQTNALIINQIDNQRLNSAIKYVKISGTRVINGTTQSYAEILQISYLTDTNTLFIKSKPTTLPLTANSGVFAVYPNSKILGIEDEINKKRTNLTFHLDSVSHSNVYNFSNNVLQNNDDLFSYPVVNNESLTDVDRGLKNHISISDVDDFDPSASFVGLSFGVLPSSEDPAATPSVYFKILDAEYGGNLKVATDKGIWTYNRLSSVWTKTDDLSNSSVVYFADQTENSYIDAAQYSGTEKGLFKLINNEYVQQTLFDKPTLSLKFGNWNDSNTFFESYGFNENLSFVLRKRQEDGTFDVASDYFDGFKINDIYYNTFYRYDEEGKRTEHPAIYLATNSSIWGLTTDEGPGSPGPSSRGENHTLLVGREMLGTNIIREQRGQISIPAKVFKIVPIPSGGRSTWLAVATSNGIYVVGNWKQCDVGSPTGLDFYPQNLSSFNQTLGLSCYTIIPKSNDSTQSIYFAATNKGVYKSGTKCGDWEFTSKFDGQVLSVNDLYYLVNGNQNYLFAATNIGIWVSEDDGEIWQPIEQFNDLNIAIPSKPVYGLSIANNPKQTFASEYSGVVNKVLVYLNTDNFKPLNGISTISAFIYSGITSFRSSNYIILNKNSASGTYSFNFNGVAYTSNYIYSIGLSSNSSLSTSIFWSFSSLSDPYSEGNALSPIATSGVDHYFYVNLATPPTPTQKVVPVGRVSGNDENGFIKGDIFGASISSQGFLYSNVGLLCNVLIDGSRSFEINDSSIITISGISTSYSREHLINFVAASGAGQTSLFTIFTTNFGTSKVLSSVISYNNSINDLIFNSTINLSDDGCFNTPSVITEGYTDDANLIISSVDYVKNSGRNSRLLDALEFSVRRQNPKVVSSFYANQLDKIDLNYVSINAAIQSYKENTRNFITLVAQNNTGQNYRFYIDGNDNNYSWVEGSYQYALIKFSDNTYEYVPSVNFSIDTYKGTGVYTGVKTPVELRLSFDWGFDEVSGELSSSFDIWSISSSARTIVTEQWAKSFKSLTLVLSDFNDNSNTNLSSVNSSIRAAWEGRGTQILFVSPFSAGNQDFILDVVSGTEAVIYTYNKLSSSDLLESLIDEKYDLIQLTNSSWSRNYDYESARYIGTIYTSYQTPGNSEAQVQFRWSKDRVNFSGWITLENQVPFILNQNLLVIQYEINFKESIVNYDRQLPFVEELYHIEITPSLHNLLTYPITVSGQLIEALPNYTFVNNNSVIVNPVVGRTLLNDFNYLEPLNQNRHSVLKNRQSSYRIVQPRAVSGLRLFPLVNSEENIGYYIINENGTIQTWQDGDVFRLFNNGTEVATSPPANAYSTVPESGIVYVEGSLFTVVEGQFLYESYTVEISYIERRQSLIGEPTFTFDNKVYFSINGSIPNDSRVLVLINQEIYKNSYSVNYTDGSVVFPVALSDDDLVTIFVDFVRNIRAGLLVKNYNPQGMTLQNFNFTFSAMPVNSFSQQAFQFQKPILLGAPFITPKIPVLDSQIRLNYTYFDEQDASENGTLISWWRKRTGIEYITYNTSYSFALSGFVGLSTIRTTSLYSQDSPFIIDVTLSSNGLSTNIVNAYIVDRGSGFIGTALTLGPSTLYHNGTAMPINLGLALTAFVQNTVYTPGYATTDGFIKINSLNPYGYSTSLNNSFGLSSLPDYDGRTSVLSADIGTRALFDGRDQIYCEVTPNNGELLGDTYRSDITTIGFGFSPIANNLLILNSEVSFNGFSTSLQVSAEEELISSYSISYPESYVNQSLVKWYKIASSKPSLISTSPILRTGLLNTSDLVYFEVTPVVLDSRGFFGIGKTAQSDIYKTI